MIYIPTWWLTDLKAHYDLEKIIVHLGKQELDGTLISPAQILDATDIRFAVRALGLYDYVDICLFLADVAQSVLPIYQRYRPNDDAPAKCIQAIRDWHVGRISNEDLQRTRQAVYDLFKTTGYVRREAPYFAARTSAYAASYTPRGTAYAAFTVFDLAIRAARSHYYDRATLRPLPLYASLGAEVSIQQKKDHIKCIFTQHFCK